MAPPDIEGARKSEIGSGMTAQLTGLERFELAACVVAVAAFVAVATIAFLRGSAGASLWTPCLSLFVLAVFLAWRQLRLPSVRRLAASVCDEGSWEASPSGFSGRMDGQPIAATWGEEGQGDFEALILECPSRLGFLVEQTAGEDAVAKLARGLADASQFRLFTEVPWLSSWPGSYALQTEDVSAFIPLMENARFSRAWGRLHDNPRFRCLVSARLPGRLETTLKAVMLGPFSGREGLVLVQMVHAPRTAQEIREDLALLAEIRQATEEI